jgi:hypothetical protein
VVSPNPFVLKCEGTTGTSRVTVWQSNIAQQVLSHDLDIDDDCNQAVSTQEKFGPDNASIAVMVNPGRMGLNAQFEAFLVDKVAVSYVGNIPVSADRVNNAQYRSYVSEPGSEWERTYEIADGKFSVSKELRLVRHGSFCVDRAGEVQEKNHCVGKPLIARAGTPICVEYQGNVGRLTSIAACNRLAAR